MKVRKILLTILIIGISIPILSADEFTISTLIDALEKESPVWQGNQSSARAAASQYRASLSSLYPSISGSLPVTYSGSSSETPDSATMLSQAGDGLSIGPEISVTQLLPTAGIFTASVGNSVEMARINDYQLPPSLGGGTGSSDPSWSNGTTITAGINQPLYFGKAYQAAKTAIEKNLENSQASVLDTGNQLVIGAITDFYGLKQSIYSLELIKTRLEKDRESYKRVETEYEMGLWTKSVLYQAQSLLLQSETDLLEAEQILEARKGLFTATYGLSSDPQISPEIHSLKEPEIDLQEVLMKVRSESPETRQLQNAIELQNSAIVSTEKNHAPTLNLGGSWNKSSGLGDNEDSSSLFSITLSLSASLYDGGSYRNNLEKMRADLSGLDATLSARMLQLENQTINLVGSIQRSKQLEELYLLQEEAARYEYDRGVLDFELGQITKKDLSELQLALENVLLGVQQNRINTNLYYLQLLAYQGEDLSKAEILRKD
ncbi:MAG: TolC family protein [Spirochaetales bacterium]|nr:TolC family protein [Spirochaetales bacterium]